MKVSAEVTISKATFEEWLEFFESYRLEREKFVTNELVQKTSDTSAKVEFEIINLDGLTDLSARSDILKREAELGVNTKLT